jgi:hypothetical protein
LVLQNVKKAVASGEKRREIGVAGYPELPVGCRNGVEQCGPPIKKEYKEETAGVGDGIPTKESPVRRGKFLGVPVRKFRLY